MNDLSFPKVQEFFTARELAEMASRWGYKGLPHSESGVIRRAKRDGWNDQPVSICRKREGKEGGGGFEYHISLLPDMQGMLLKERLLKTGTSVRNAVAVRNEAVAVPASAALARRSRTTAEARSEIMVAIIGYAARRGKKISQGMADFLTAQEGHRLWRESCAARDRGDYLDAPAMRAIQLGSPMERPFDPKSPYGFGVSEEILAQANNRPRKDVDFCTVSERSLARWMKAHRERGFVALAPAATKAAEPIPEDFWRFMRFFALPAKPAISRSHRKYLESTPAGITPMTIDQVKYTLREKLDHIERNKGREGALTLRSRMAYVSRDTSDLLPTTIYVADGHTFDAEVADPNSYRAMRPEITSIMDGATRRLVGWAISRKENVIAVTEALRNACLENGLPAVFYVDRGAGYKNKTFDDNGNGLMSRLGIDKMHALPYGSQAKGNIERSHQTIWITLAKEFPTYLGDAMDKEARQKAFRQSRKEIAEFGSSSLLMPWETFRAEVARRAAEYNDEPHSSLPRIIDPVTGQRRFMTPNEAWEMHVRDGFEPVRIDPEMMDDLFRPYVERTVARCLVQWNTNEYFSLDLNPYHEQKVFVGYDDAQADKVWVREIDRETGEPGRLITIAIYGGNKVSYMPRTRIAAATEQRQKGALKRLEAKVRDVEAERDAPYLLEHQPVQTAGEVFDFPAFVPAVPADSTVRKSEVSDQTKPKRRTFGSDEELAAWALKHPNELIPKQIILLRQCVNNSVKADLFRMSGIDLEALRTLLRAVA
ncbi:Mu transposase C-terminal domain-containing protein [Paenirhodobacter populi]|uniref:Transposase n=1 Tax=Paenirhodobacter populi TaxID=2306993 RepID=A0A443J0Z5_9RHOB|nr:Mu transposase C-terminal domain-containing protein [Sinirhodobacter populi]RWR14228.1 hypothetical protein D2T33_03140 [Sinirhodobacter populi]